MTFIMELSEVIDMEANNPLYKNQGAHVIATLFTVDKGTVKVLLIKRSNNPYKGMWALVGGALYNNENIEDGIAREIREKSGLHNIDLYFTKIYGSSERKACDFRMLGISYIGVIDFQKVELLSKTIKTDNADWVPIELIPELAYDHNEVVKDSLEVLKTKIVNSSILKALFPTGFTIPELHKIYESILDKKIDRRNLRRKLLSIGLIYDTKKTVIFEGKKPAKLYKFKDIDIKSINI